MKDKKIAVTLTDDCVHDPFMPKYFEEEIDYRDVRGNLDPNRHVVFFGSGTDISPIIYGHRRMQRTQQPQTARDLWEMSCWSEVLLKSIPNVGICRGAQLICALNGGELFQDVTGHCGGDHLITFADGRAPVESSSVHHQMMDLGGLKPDTYDLLAWSSESLSDYYISDDDARDPDKEPEIVFFKRSNSLAIQGHPEFMRYGVPFVKECRNLFETLFVR